MRPCIYDDVERVVAVGDLHGNYAGFCAILRHCGLINSANRWIARRTHLVQMGDVLGRGGEPGKILTLLRRLEAEARQYDSEVHTLLGNHETMSLCGFHAYRTPEEVRDFLEQRGEFSFHEEGGDEVEISRPDWSAAPQAKKADLPHKLRFDLSPKGRVGQWMTGLNSAMKINGMLFVHGGLTRDFGFESLALLNERICEELRLEEGNFDSSAYHLGRRGPQWTREYALRPTESMREELEDVLRFHRCTAMVVGHTPTFHIDKNRAGDILPLYDNQLFCTDTGIGKVYGGRLSALLMEQGEYRYSYPGRS